METPHFKRVLFLLIDGARDDVMVQLIESGELPNLKRFVLDPGSYRTAISVFPSTTGPAHLPFLTGCTPGMCDVPGIRWFDRRNSDRFTHFRQCRSYVGPGSLYLDRDVGTEIPSIFQFFERPAAVFSVFNRGIRARRRRAVLDKWRAWLYGHYTGDWQAVDAAAWRYAHRAVERELDFLFVLLPAVDELTHLSHPFSDPVLEAYREIDRSFGRFVNHLFRHGILDDTLFVVSSDHGLTATHTHMELFDLLDRHGRNTLYYPKILRNNVSAVAMVSGNAMANVYLRNGRNWGVGPAADAYSGDRTGTGDLISACLAEEAIDLVIERRSRGSIRVHGREGVAEISEEGETLRYRISGRDPFGYQAMPSLLTHDQSLSMTFDSCYPDAPYQLIRLFTSPRAGDLVISARKGYDLRLLHEKPEHLSSHGSLHREHMRVPLLINHPIQQPFVRTVDVFPSMLELLGRQTPDAIDGRSFVSKGRMQQVPPGLASRNEGIPTVAEIGGIS